MRTVLALIFACYVAALAAMPHAHSPSHDGHACIACSTRASEACDPAVRDLSPRIVVASVVVTELESVPATGAPLGAKPGQSPPRA